MEEEDKGNCHGCIWNDMTQMGGGVSSLTIFILVREMRWGIQIFLEPKALQTVFRRLHGG